MSVEKTKISKRIQRFLVQRGGGGGGGGRKGERKSQFSTESSSRVSKKAPEVADDSCLSLSLSLSSRARTKRGRDSHGKKMCLGKKNSRAFVTFVTTTARLLFEQQELRENDDVEVVARKVFAGEKIVVFIVLCTSFFRECLTKRGLLRKNCDAMTFFAVAFFYATSAKERLIVYRARFGRRRRRRRRRRR